MLNVSADGVDAALTFKGLVETLREAFRAGAVQPVRHHHTVERPDGAASTLLLMPAWTDFSADGARRQRPYRRQDRHRLARQQRARQAGGDGPLSAARRAHRRAAGADRRPAADAMAHRLRVGACRLLPRPPGRVAAAGDRRRRALPVPGEGAFGGAADSRNPRSGTGRSPMPRRRRRRCARTASTPPPYPISMPR